DVTLWRFVSTTLHHYDGVFRGSYSQIDVGLLDLFESWVGDQASLHTGYTNTDDRAFPWDVGNVQGRAGADEREHVRRVLLVTAEDRRDDLRVLLVALREQGAKRTIHQTCRQRF